MMYNESGKRLTIRERILNAFQRHKEGNDSQDSPEEAANDLVGCKENRIILNKTLTVPYHKEII